MGEVDMMLSVSEIFASIQSEGPFAGCPAVFVRMAGCNLTCGFCDTIHEPHLGELNEDEILEYVAEASNGKIGLVVLTGGEPLMQEVGVLIPRLGLAGYKVQIETNGTMIPEDRNGLKKAVIVCSPKSGHPVNPELMPYINAYKLLVVEGHQPEVPDLLKSTDQIYVQPLDCSDPDQNQRNAQWAVAVCLETGFMLSYQIHKIIGIR